MVHSSCSYPSGSFREVRGLEQVSHFRRKVFGEAWKGRRQRLVAVICDDTEHWFGIRRGWMRPMTFESRESAVQRVLAGVFWSTPKFSVNEIGSGVAFCDVEGAKAGMRFHFLLVRMQGDAFSEICLRKSNNMLTPEYMLETYSLQKLYEQQMADRQGRTRALHDAALRKVAEDFGVTLSPRTNMQIPMEEAADRAVA